MNIVMLVGRLTKDPELRFIPGSGTPVATFNIAVNRPFSKDKTADFFRIVVFGKQGENCANYLAKGRQVAISGRLQNNNYETQSGEKRYTIDIIADRVEFLGSTNSNRDNNNSMSDIPIPDQSPEGFQALDDDDDDIPF